MLGARSLAVAVCVVDALRYFNGSADHFFIAAEKSGCGERERRKGEKGIGVQKNLQKTQTKREDPEKLIACLSRAFHSYPCVVLRRCGGICNMRQLFIGRSEQ